MKSGTTSLIVAWNNEDPPTGNNEWKYHFNNRTSRSVILHSFKEQNIEEQEILHADAFTYDVRMPNVSIFY
jgi:hypothetical protein